MDEPFTLTVPYKGKQLQLETSLIVIGYTYKFVTIINEREVFFERDDAGEFRALVPEADNKQAKSIDIELLQAIAQQLEQILS